MLLEERVEKSATAKELALEKKLAVLRQKYQQLESLHKLCDDKMKTKVKINRTGGFVPEEEAQQR